MVHTTSPTSLVIDSGPGRKLFVFDRVFGEDVYQEGVWEYVHESVNSFLQGYNVSVLAYGQSGSGKSFTMGTSGPAEQSDPQLMGMLLIQEGMETLAFYELTLPRRRYSTCRTSPLRYAGRAPLIEASWIVRNANAHKIFHPIYPRTSVFSESKCSGRKELANESYLRRSMYAIPRYAQLELILLADL